MKTVTAIILAHFKEREQNLPKIIYDLKHGEVAPDKIVIVVDNPAIDTTGLDASIIQSATPLPVISRYAIGLIQDTDYCFFVDDDLTVGPRTLSNFLDYATEETTILGLEGNILNTTANPYTDGTTVDRGQKLQEVDIIIRTYFVPRECLAAPLYLRAAVKDLPQTSIDDVLLCMGNKFLNDGGKNMVIPVSPDADMIELDAGNVGQCYSPEHYTNRNTTINILRSIYEDDNP